MELNDTRLHPYERAIVIGAGVAGLLSARVLADYFREVVVIERDFRTAQPAFRRGAPQGQHAHLLLDTGMRIIERYFPGIRAALIHAGATNLNAGLDIRHRQDGIRRPEYLSEFSALSISRPVLEWHLAGRLRQLPNVDIVQGSAVRKIDCVGSQVVGVHLTAATSRFDRQYLSGSLVIDASGRGSWTTAMLSDCGFTRPRETVSAEDTVHVSRIFRIPDGQRHWKCLIARIDTRGATLVPIDREHWLVTLHGPKDRSPPLDAAGFMRFLADLPDTHGALFDAQAVTDACAFRTPAHVRRHYEELQHFPDGLLVIGDALCDLPATLHQGMTLAALQAQTLQDCLEHRAQREWPLSEIWRDFFRRCAGMIDACWQMSTLRTRGPGAGHLHARFMHWYIREILAAAGTDIRVAERWLAAVHRIEPLRTLLSARVIGSLLSGIGHAHTPRELPALSCDETTMIRPRDERTQPG